MISLDFIAGKITHDDLSSLRTVPIAKQAGLLKEDMLQVEYANGVLLDVGWYPSFDAKGGFHINVIKNHDWDRPVFSVTARETAELLRKLTVAQDTINGELRS